LALSQRGWRICARKRDVCERHKSFRKHPKKGNPGIPPGVRRVWIVE
jgi:hypothetical protein